VVDVLTSILAAYMMSSISSVMCRRDSLRHCSIIVMMVSVHTTGAVGMRFGISSKLYMMAGCQLQAVDHGGLCDIQECVDSTELGMLVDDYRAWS
jgi:hypothetical protein